jgi:hypothetical protein
MALSAKANIRTKSIDLEDVPLKSGYKVYQGGIVVIDTANGYGRPAFTGTGLVAKGVAQKTVDNTSAGTLPGANTDGGLKVPVKRGVSGPYSNDSAPYAVSVANRGAVCYLIDDNTVSTNSSGTSVAGIVEDVDDDGVWVEISPIARQS